MTGLHFPFLELTILLPLLGSLFLIGQKDPVVTRQRALWAAGATLVSATGAWIDFATLHVFEAHDAWSVIQKIFGRELFVIDELSAPLLPLSALIFFLTKIATVGHKAHSFSYVWGLVSECITLAILSSKEPNWLVVLFAISGIPIIVEMWNRKRSIRMFLLHHSLFVICCAIGIWIHQKETHIAITYGAIFLAIAVFIRCGMVPLHCWISDLGERASFGSMLLYLSPMLGAYACMRLLLPNSPEWALRIVSWGSMFTALYSSGMALVQVDARRFFSYLFLSHSSLVLVGLELATPIGLTGALSMWISVGIALTGFGITLRCVEARVGRIQLNQYYGLYSHMPSMAAFFLLAGLASVGFPCTIGFIATELLIEGAIDTSPAIGILVVLSTAFNGIAVLNAYFKIFTGTKHQTSVSLVSQPEERFAVIALSLLIIGGGLYPQPGIDTRFRAAIDLRKNLHFTAGDHSHHRLDGSLNPDQEVSPNRGTSTNDGPSASSSNSMEE